MARYSATYSGDTTSFIGGKIASAAGMARNEAEAQEKDRQAGLNVSNSGNLFAKALGSEFGGDLFSRTVGVFNPNQSAAQTDRASTKARRFAANFPRTEKQEEEVKKSKEDVDRAVDDLLKDDDHTPVKDEDLREYVTRVFGVGIDSKLVQVDQRVSKSVDVLSDIKKVHQGSVNLMIDHNELIAGKLDKILKLYSDQYDFQQTLKDRAETTRSENELERKRNLSSSKRYTGLNNEAGGSAILGAISDIVGKKLWNRIAEKLGLKRVQKVAANVGLDSISTRIGKTAFKHTRGSTILNEIFQGPKFTKEILRNPKKAITNVIKIASSKELYNYWETGVGRKDLQELTGKWSPQQGMDALTEAIRNPNITPDQAIAKQTMRAGRKTAIDITKEPKVAAAFVENLNKGIVPGSELFEKNLIKQSTNAAGQKVSKKLASKTGAKAVAKTGKLVPGVGTVIALGEAAYRASQGDMTGAGLSLLSAIPIVGWGFTAVDIARDLGVNPLGLPEPPQETTTDQSNLGGYYESGTSMLTRPGVKVLHGREKVLGVDPGTGMTTNHIQNIGDTIVSASAKMASDLGVNRDISNEIASLPFDVKRVNYSTDVKTAPVKSRSTTDSIYDVQSDISKFKKEAEGGMTRDDSEMSDQEKRQQTQDKRWIIDPRRHIDIGNGGQVNTNVVANNNLVKQSGNSTIEFHGEQGIDRSGEPGIDFSFADYKNNYNLFDGVVLETGLLYGQGYGNVVVVRSIDPSNGREFDSLYSHFPDGGIAVRVGDTVKGGDLLGKVGFVSAPSGSAEIQPNNAGNMSGWHTSVDFFEPGSNQAYSNVDAIRQLVLSSAGRKPNNLLARMMVTATQKVVPDDTGSKSIVEYYTGDQSHKRWEPYLHDGSNEHEHYGFSSTEERDLAMAILRKHGLIVDPGGNPGDHTEGSLHYEDRALDVKFGPHMTQDKFDWARQLMGKKSRHRFSNDAAGEEEFAHFVRQILIDNGFTGIDQTDVGPKYFQEHGTVDSGRFTDLSDPFLNKMQHKWNIPENLHKRNLELQNNSMFLDGLEAESASGVQVVVLNNTIVNHTTSVNKNIDDRGPNIMSVFRMAKLAG